MLPDNLPDLGQRLGGSGRRLGVHQGDESGGRTAELGGDLLGVDDLSPRHFDRSDHGTSGFRQLDKALSEMAGDPDDYLVARGDQVEDDRLQTAGTGCRHRNRVMVVSPEERAEIRHRFFHDGEEVRIEVADERSRHRSRDFRGRVGRSRAEEQDLRRS